MIRAKEPCWGWCSMVVTPGAHKGLLFVERLAITREYANTPFILSTQIEVFSILVTLKIVTQWWLHHTKILRHLLNDKAKDGTINIQQLLIEIHISKSSELLDAIFKKACQHRGSFKLQRRTTRELWGTNAPPALKPIFQSGWKTLASHFTGPCGYLSLHWAFIHQRIPFLWFGDMVDRSRNRCPCFTQASSLLFTLVIMLPSVSQALVVRRV